MTYQAPLADIGFALKHGAAFSAALDEGLFGDLTMDVVEAVLAEAGRLAGEDGTRPVVEAVSRLRQ